MTLKPKEKKYPKFPIIPLDQNSYIEKICQKIIFQNKLLEMMIIPKKYEKERKKM